MVHKTASKNLSKFSKKELDTFFKHAKRVYKDQAFTILTNKTELPFAKVLIVVSKKYGNAPERNRIKRRLKSIFREEKLYEKQYNIAFIIRPEAKTWSFEKLKQLCLKVIVA